MCLLITLILINLGIIFKNINAAFSGLRNGCLDCRFDLHKKGEKLRTSLMSNLVQVFYFLLHSERFCIHAV